MNTNDPRLTAHALGEADAESAALIENDQALASESKAIGRFAAVLRREFSAEPAPPLQAAQRSAIVAEAAHRAIAVRWRAWTVGAAAACVVFGLGAAIHFQARHLHGLRPVANSAQPSAHTVATRLSEDSPGSVPDEVVPPGPGTVAAQPANPSPAIDSTRIERAPGFNAPPAAIARPPTLVTASPAPRVDPATVPLKGSAPATSRHEDPVRTQIGSKNPQAR